MRTHCLELLQYSAHFWAKTTSGRRKEEATERKSGISRENKGKNNFHHLAHPIAPHHTAAIVEAAPASSLRFGRNPRRKINIRAPNVESAALCHRGVAVIRRELLHVKLLALGEN